MTSQMQDHKPVVDHFSNGSNSCNISSSENDITIYIHQLPPPPKNGLSWTSHVDCRLFAFNGYLCTIFSCRDSKNIHWISWLMITLNLVGYCEF